MAGAINKNQNSRSYYQNYGFTVIRVLIRADFRKMAVET